jgi:hypothetical protein
MKSNPRNVFRAASVVLSALGALAPAAAGAGIVHIAIQQRGKTEFGAGYTVGRGQECFIVTPYHVVQFAPADAISVTDTKGSVAKARLLKGSEEFDAALLQVVGTSALDCPADWSDGANAVAAINGAQFLIARKVDDNGRVMQSRFFAASTSREQVELAPFGANDELREGDSGSALYAGDALVGLVVSVDTKTRQALAVTQSQLHGLFGADVLPGARRVAALAPFTYRRAPNAYASTTARDYLAAAGLKVMDAAADGGAPPGADYVIAGAVIDVTSTRAANPNYKPPERAAADESLGRQLFRSLEKRVAAEVNDALDRNSEAQFLRTFNVDVQVQILKTADGSKVMNLERRSITLPETAGAPAADLEKTAVTDAVKQALGLTFEKYPL